MEKKSKLKPSNYMQNLPKSTGPVLREQLIPKLQHKVYQQVVWYTRLADCSKLDEIPVFYGTRK